MAADTNDAGNRDVILSICIDSIADYVLTGCVIPNGSNQSLLAVIFSVGYMIFAKDDDFHNLAHKLEDFARRFKSQFQSLKENSFQALLDFLF